MSWRTLKYTGQAKPATLLDHAMQELIDFDALLAISRLHCTA